METKLSKLLTGFRKNHSTQHALLKAIETWKEHLNKGDKVGATLWIYQKLLILLITIYFLQS